MGLFKKTTSDDAKEAPKKEEAKSKATKTAKPKKTVATKKTATKTTKPSAGSTGNAYKVLVRPMITEKAGFLGQENKYVFEVTKGSNKVEIAKAVEQVYGIKPVSVNVMNREGKKVRRGRTFGKRKDWRKAIVKLPEGKTINIYEGV